MSSVVFLSSHDHRDLKLISKRFFPHAKNHHMCYLLVHEFPQAALNFPIVFIKDEDTGQFKPVAMFGFKEGENVFYEEPQWNSTYIPANIRRHPFLMSPKTENDQDWSICIDKDSEHLSTKDGEALFDSEGKPSQQLEDVKVFLADFIEKDHLTTAFTKQLASLDLFKQNSLVITESNGEQVKVNGVYSIDEEKLNDLSDSDYLMLKKRGFIGPIYTHLTALGQMERIKILRNLK